MSHSILYRRLFVKLPDESIIAFIEAGDNNVYDVTCFFAGFRNRYGRPKAHDQEDIIPVFHQMSANGRRLNKLTSEYTDLKYIRGVSAVDAPPESSGAEEPRSIRSAVRNLEEAAFRQAPARTKRRKGECIHADCPHERNHRKARERNQGTPRHHRRNEKVLNLSRPPAFAGRRDFSYQSYFDDMLNHSER